MSGGASLAVAIQVAQRAPEGSVTCCMLPDTGKRYLRASQSRPGPTHRLGAPSVTPPQPAAALKRRFYRSSGLDAVQAKKQFADLVDEVVLQFTAKPGVKVRIAIEVEAESAAGFDDGLQQVVKENCKTLKFKAAGFEPGQ